LNLDINVKTLKEILFRKESPAPESTGIIVIPFGITSSWARNSQEEWSFHVESQAPWRGIHQRNGHSTWNHKLLGEEFTGGIVIHQELAPV
jgi:hypothetical protein